jgi:hypothetical protein
LKVAKEKNMDPRLNMRVLVINTIVRLISLELSFSTLSNRVHG